ncbi:hypothetical protein UM91_18405 [Pseudomonas oryzihabitans]|nr:hypothetical protein UM91_18405 [Pseudomonas oryzihabitans]
MAEQISRQLTFRLVRFIPVHECQGAFQNLPMRIRRCQRTRMVTGINRVAEALKKLFLMSAHLQIYPPGDGG